MTRLGIDVQTLETDERNRGIGRYTRGLLEGLAMLPEGAGAARPELHLFGFGADSPLKVEGGRVRYHRYPAAIDREQYLEYGVTAPLAWAAADLDLDAFLVSSPLMPTVLVPRHAPCPVGCILYDLIPLIVRSQRPNILPPHLWLRYYQQLELARGYDFTVAISESTRRDAVTWLDWPEDRIVNISTGIDPRFFAAVAEEEVAAALARHGIERPYLLTVSGFDFRKNWEGTLEAFARLPKGVRRGRRLVVVCELTREQQLVMREKARELGVGAAVTFTGFVPDEDLPAFYRGAECFLFTSLYEGFGIPVAESLASGCPVVVADHSSLPEVVGDCGRLADPRDPAAFARALEETLAEPWPGVGREAAVERCRREFCWETIARRFAEWLEEFLARQRRGRTQSPPPAEGIVAPRYLAEDFQTELLRAFVERGAERLGLPVVETAQDCGRPIHPVGPGMDLDYTLRSVEAHGGRVWLLDPYLGPTLEELDRRGLNAAEWRADAEAAGADALRQPLLERMLRAAEGVLAAPLLAERLGLAEAGVEALDLVALAAGLAVGDRAAPADAGGGLRVLALGDFDGGYAHQELLEAACRLTLSPAPDAANGWRLTLAGRVVRPDVLAQLRKQQLEERLYHCVKFAPLAELDELWPLLAECQLVAFLPRAGAGSALLAAVALAGGRPVLAPNFPEFAGFNAKAALRFEPGCALADQLTETLAAVLRRPALLRIANDE